MLFNCFFTTAISCCNVLHDLLEQLPPRNEMKSSNVNNTGKTDKFNIHQLQILLDINTDTITYNVNYFFVYMFYSYIIM